MRILFLAHSFNSLAQRLFVELRSRGHELSIELDVADSVSIEAARLFAPDLIVAPFLKRAIPEALWSRHVCLVVHPGIVGDRGPSALDWAILEGEREWGVTVLQANGEMDAGDVWASRVFPMRAARKSSVYRNEVTEAATEAVLEAVEKFASQCFRPRPLASFGPHLRGRLRPPVRQDVRRIDWQRDTTATVLAKIRCSDGAPGVAEEIGGRTVHLFDAHPEGTLRGPPGAFLATREGAVCRATVDGAVWIGYAKAADPGFKLPAATVLADALTAPSAYAAGLATVGDAPAGLAARSDPRAIPDGALGTETGRPVPELPLPVLPNRDPGTWQDIAYDEAGGVGTLHFDFHNGAMSTRQCERLVVAFRAAAARPTRVIVLAGGRDFWSNGIHLNAIEAAESPADESMRNIEAMDELCLAILTCTTHATIAAMRGNAGAGGVFLALAADRVWARRGVVLNPHYRGMGNLYGSEYWTYLLPARVGAVRAQSIVDDRLPVGAPEAAALGLIDECFGSDADAFLARVHEKAKALAADPSLPDALARKAAHRAEDEAKKPLAAYRDEELARMRLNFYGFDPSYHVARYHFVHRLPHAWTPLHLARHRRQMWRRQSLLGNRAAAAGAGTVAAPVLPVEPDAMPREPARNP